MRVGRGSSLALVVAVLLIGGLVSAVVYDAQRHNETHYAAQLMDRHADVVTEAITDRVDHYSDTLTDLALAVGAEAEPRADLYERLTAGLDVARLPGASGVAFVVAARTAQVGSVQRTWRTRGSAGLRLTPAPGHDEHLFVVFDRVFDSSPGVLGLDLAQSPQAVEALRTARQSGALAISPAYQLLRDRGVATPLRQTSVAFAAPVHAGLSVGGADTFEGWIVMAVRGQDFLAQTLIDRGQGAIQVSLADPAAAGAVIAAARPGRRLTDDRLDRERILIVGQRRWQVSMWPTRRLMAITDRGISMITGGSGIALTIMLAVVTGVLAGSRSRALHQVEQATAALRGDIDRREAVEARLREREHELHHLAFHDPLTGLANRQLFYERLTHALTTRGERFIAVLFIDLDGFKEVNDARGHHAGDIVLKTVAERLHAGVRISDTAARFGGDEFAVLLESLTDVGDAHTAAARAVADVQQPIDITGISVTVSASVGIAVHVPGGADSADDLLRGADAAMYAAKAAGKNRYVLAEAGR
ncbi:diguanylate cyclase [Actinoplanes sp. TBRC 11911]|uniref:sensor domain-containing diguanylate cyclase n=1 Tax=Actinoplanes sp. TBRC 11911 TaxID=2729386 RepID=UPI00145EDC91|nr:sensor domain-containing diguanylate cyclase [Actinoplanes sp. TBRC 11911]NMO54576.1 diguanylate cyclase [Actinoplanes sp. TBRC 11911]